MRLNGDDGNMRLNGDDGNMRLYKLTVMMVA